MLGRKHKDNGTPPPSNGRNGHDKDRNDKPKKASRKDSNKGQRKTKDKQYGSSQCQLNLQLLNAIIHSDNMHCLQLPLLSV